MMALYFACTAEEQAMGKNTTVGERTIINCALLATTPENVFDALTTAQSLQKFFGSDAEFERGLAGNWRMFDDACPKKTEGHGVVTAWEPPHLVRMSWSWYRTDLPDTEVTYRILEHEKGSLLLVHHHGWGEGSEWDFEYDDHSAGWPKVMTGLAAFLGATIVFATPSMSKSDSQAYEILRSQRDHLQSQYDAISQDSAQLRKDIDKLKSTVQLDNRELGQIENRLQNKEFESRRLELDIRDIDLLMK
jgi:uncharacterized protein YndB with AHSA1/START domain